MGRWIVLFIFIAISISCVSTPEGNLQKLPLDQGIESLSSQIITNMTTVGKQRLAILDFKTLDDQETLLGKLLAEELINNFYTKQQFRVVERRLIEEAFKELKFQISGAVNEKNVMLLGRTLGVEVIVIGTIADLGKIFRLNGRLMNVETGEILGVAKSDIIKDDRLAHLLGQDGGTDYKRAEEAYKRGGWEEGARTWNKDRPRW